ncbi:MAG: hypothetical protein QW112_04045 [Candidatus Micrarchaeia archaeon]
MPDEISEIISKFEKIMGPVARRIANETAEKMKIIKGGKISPSDEDEKRKFLRRLSDEYSNIIGRKVVDTIIRL